MILKAENIYKSFHADSTVLVEVIKDISLSVKKGEYLAIKGSSGAGKSTLLNLLASFDTIDSGEISLIVDSKELKYSQLNDTQISKMRLNHIGFVFQQYNLLPEFTALENISMPALILSLSKKEIKERGRELLQFVGLESRAEHKPSELSGGEQQRVAIARALMNKPQIIFADEPTGALDNNNSTQILDLIEKLISEFGLTFVTATHSDLVARRSERIVEIKDGQLI